MFCNNCGKDNPTGTKFCTQCGTPLPVETAAPVAENDAAAVTYGGKALLSDGIKSLVIMGLIAVMAIIAVVNIFKVGKEITKINVYDEEFAANNAGNLIVDTKEYVYYQSGEEWYRANKGNGESNKISNKVMWPVAASSNAMYFTDEKNNFYKVEDKDSEAEKIGKRKGYADTMVSSIAGRYIYKVDYSGKIEKCLNSSEYGNKSIPIFKLGSKENAGNVKIYKGFAYMNVYKSGDGEESSFIRVSLSNGKREELYDEDLGDYVISDNMIVALINGGDLLTMKTNGGDSDVSDEGVTYIIGAVDGYVFYKSYDDDSYEATINRLNVKENSVEEIDIDESMGYMQELSDCLVVESYENNEYILYDVDGNEISTIELEE